MEYARHWLRMRDFVHTVCAKDAPITPEALSSSSNLKHNVLAVSRHRDRGIDRGSAGVVKLKATVSGQD
jgi:hypothetical protein